MVVAEDVEKTVDEKVGDLAGRRRGWLQLGLGFGNRQADDDLTKRWLFVRGVHERLTLGCGEGEDVGRLVTAAVEAVELAARCRSRR